MSVRGPAVLAVVAFLLLGCGGSSSGSAGDGGLVGSGGAPGVGGGGATGGATGTGGAVACTGAAVTFRMTAPAGRASSYCVGRECGGSWVTVRTPAGVEVPITWPCVTDCGGCAPIACKMSCLAPAPLTDAGQEQTWDGSLYAMSTCGAGLACIDKSCAAAGQYTAKMCAYPRINADAGLGCESDPTPVCVEVPFTYPSATVAGTLGN